jgi:hypothetical protein
MPTLLAVSVSDDTEQAVIEDDEAWLVEGKAGVGGWRRPSPGSGLTAALTTRYLRRIIVISMRYHKVGGVKP